MYLEQSPPGYHVDELSGSVTVQCLAEEGIDAHDKRYPLFGTLNYGSPKPPTYMYPAAIWTKIFGYSIASFRSYTAFGAVLTLLGLFLFGRFIKDWRLGLLMVLAASISPWGFQISRIALEGIYALCFMVWGMYFFCCSKKWFSAFTAGVLFSAAMYTYPPTRLHMPLVFLALVFLRYTYSGFSIRYLSICLASWILMTIPLIIGTLNGVYSGRFGIIGIFNEQYLSDIGKTGSMIDLMGIFINNYLKHLNLDFLFFKGDTNYVYSTGHFGLFSWLDIVTCLASFILLMVLFIQIKQKKTSVDPKDGAFMLLVVFGMATAIIPSALTWQDIPHSYRIIGMWPFLMMFSGYILYVGIARWRVVWMPVVFIALFFSSIYFPYYYQKYPKTAYYMFNGYTKDQALNMKTDHDWLGFAFAYRKQNFHLRYYMMNYMQGQDCSSTQAIWRQVYPL